MKLKQGAADYSTKHQDVGSSGRHVIHNLSVRKREDDNADRYLPQKIMQNKQYSICGRADDEHDFEDGPSQKSRKKREANDNNGAERAIARRILTQQERCLLLRESKLAKTPCCGNSKFHLFDVATVAACRAWSLLHLTNAGNRRS